MRSLGDFSADSPVDEEEVTFVWYGADIRVHPELSDTQYVDWMEEYGSLDVKDVKAASAVKEFVRVVVHPDDFDEFWALGKKHRVGQERFAATAHKLIEAVAERPTEQSSDSSDGLSETGESSTAASFERVIREHEEQGRPDLALVYVEAREARQAS